MATQTTRHRILLTTLVALFGAYLALASIRQLAAQEPHFLGDRGTGLSIEPEQQWGDFGLNVAAAQSGRPGAPLQIGKTTYEKGLGHHANGEIVVALAGQFRRFRARVGVQWQGGNRGSVIFRVLVDGQMKFQSETMSDSDPAVEVEVPLAGARELRLVASDAGDGIGCDMANWIEAHLERDPNAPFFGNPVVTFDGEAAPARSASAAGFSLIARERSPQVAVMETAGMLVVDVAPGEEVGWAIPIKQATKPVRVMADVRLLPQPTTQTLAATQAQPGQVEVELSLGDARVVRTVGRGDHEVLATDPVRVGGKGIIRLITRAKKGEAAVRFSNLRYCLGDAEFPIPMLLGPPAETIPPPVLPAMRPAIEQALVEWDWRMQDGIGTAREACTWEDAIGGVLDSGDRLIGHLHASDVVLGQLGTEWEALRAEVQAMSAAGTASAADWETAWRRVHVLRRGIAFANPLARVGPLVFVKRVPSGFSHQLTQYGGWRARPGGGVFVLEAPGESMRCRRLDSLPAGSYMHPEVSWDGRRVLFSFCETDPNATEWLANMEQFYHLFEVSTDRSAQPLLGDGSGQRQLTEGSFDDFSPRYLPDGKILFVSTRRGGFHRCGRGPCPVYTMAVAEADGSNPRVISFHETHEWDPALLNDGRVIYTRWDYVDRHAVHYQQLWTVRADGSDVRAFYGNNTLNPVGVWEARPIPGSPRVMATAAAHHAMTAGSIILLDVTKGIDGLGPITRLTPDALFPESEFPIQRWHATAGVPEPPEVPRQERRWPAHCYRSPYPLSEEFFLCAYSFDPLIGEPKANRPNMFGIYLVDRFGNKELLYRDVSIGSLWPTPLRPRKRPPSFPSAASLELVSLGSSSPPLLSSASVASTLPSSTDRKEPLRAGTFLLQDVYASWPQVSERDAPVKRLRIVQVLPKTTPHANTPRVGLAHASPGKQVLGTVPVEADGSAYFRAPAGIPLAFQALDARGMAIQTMRSLTYLQPGERAGCVGCHEHRTTAPVVGRVPLAGRREPSSIAPGPDGSKPLNYARLVQPILDAHCVRCHGARKPDGGIDLTSVPAGQFTKSYNALVKLVPFSEWKGTPQLNHEPLTHPNRFGARPSRLMELLDKGHEDVTLSEAEYERLITWMDANALFYGTFEPEDQERQRRGERIAGPALE